MRGFRNRPSPLAYVLIPKKRHGAACDSSNHVYMTQRGRSGVHVSFIVQTQYRMVGILRVSAKGL